MSGILERIEKKLDRILAMSSPIKGEIVETPVEELLGEMEQEQNLGALEEVSELDKQGIRWDSRIHT